MAVLFMCLIMLLGACSQDEKLFSIRSSHESGLDFNNVIVTSDTFNALNFDYIYNGAGLGVGDFNNDGLQDVFFAGNQVSSKLFLNRGNLTFYDVTREAGVATEQWITGVSVVDINRDGLSDIYLSVAGKTNAKKRRNLLFVNAGITGGVPVFRECANAFGLDSERYSTMAAFFDYDKDGDADVYLLNNWLEKFNRNNLRPRRINGESESNDQLFRNNGDNTFTDVSREAGILIEGYGLGVAVADLNDDSWPDVYVANDFMSNDLLWINQRDGTFKNEIAHYLKHQTHNGMGVDIADFNNDALADIMVVDMLPPGHQRQKMMTPGQNYDHFHMSLQLGYEPQYMRNTLQLNRGKMPDGSVLFSEIAFMAGVAATDWSWAPLFADFDNDGWKDIFIANGYRKDVTNLDFIFFGMDDNPFGTADAREKMWRERFSTVPDVKLSNYIFRNNGSLVFEDKTKAWGIELPGFSNGAAYADFDNDGDLDLITNNIDEEATLYENNLNRVAEKKHFLRLSSNEPGSFNEKIWVYAGGIRQYVERTSFRGFQSTVENYAHFGLGGLSLVDSVIIQWPDSMQLKLFNILADTTIYFSKEKATRFDARPPENNRFEFVREHLASYRHQGDQQSDIKSTRTLLHELSRYGPCLAKADVNADGLDDLYVGGDISSPSELLIQQGDGTFKTQDIDTGGGGKDDYAVFFDADADGDPDLYIAQTAPLGTGSARPHRLYINDGAGNFGYVPGAVPLITTFASCVETADIDNDGDLDLFVGGRVKVGQYPYSPRSYILRNDAGTFTDVTERINASLVEPGMVSSAVWADINNDRKIDLIIAGEWQPVRIFQNDGTMLTEVTDKMGLKNSNGWWNCIKTGDLNNDGFLDLVVGNTGKNSFFKPTAQTPVQIIAKDFDANGSIDPIVTYHNPVEDDRFVVHNRLVLIDQIPAMKKRFETFTQYASRPFESFFTDEEVAGSLQLSTYKLESVALINHGGEGFVIHDLPDIVQASTVNDLLIEDVNADGRADIIAVGNMYGQETFFGRYDASLGTILLGDGNLNWSELPPRESGFVVPGDARYIESLRSVGGRIYVITNNNDSLQFFAVRPDLRPIARGR